MSINKDLPELLEANIITIETAERIRDYYNNKGSSSVNRLLVVFGILGAILTGLGIILVIAHNWDEISRSAKTTFAFLPLILGQLLCFYAIWKKHDNAAWVESAASFLFCSIGASIALVSQIYNIPGGTGTFMFTWMLLCLPLIYLLKSSMASLLYISGITYYAIFQSFFSFPESDSNNYWLMLAGVLPFCLWLYRKKLNSNFTAFHSWILPISLIITLGTVSEKYDEIMFIAYFSMFGVFYLLGHLPVFDNLKPRSNGYKILGSLGTVFMMIMLTFDWIWKNLRKETYSGSELFVSPEFIASSVTTLTGIALLLYIYWKKIFSEARPLSFMFLLFILTFLFFLNSPVAIVLMNLFVLAVGILTIMEGSKKNHLGVLNYGLLIITSLVICRFFDTDLSFVARGILFISVGAGFFIANYRMLKKRKSNEQ